jgi:hypothetical protein
MRFGKVRRATGEVAVVVVENDLVFTLDTSRRPDCGSLADLLRCPDPLQAAR